MADRPLEALFPTQAETRATISARPSATDPVLTEVGSIFPRLRPFLTQATVRYAPPRDDRQLEFYPPWERDNPEPGRLTVEVYNPRLQGRDLTESIGLDLLHHLGGTDPNGAAVDPQYRAIRQEMAQAIESADSPIDRRAYAEEAMHRPDAGSYSEWLDRNRVDAYIRGFLSPRLNPEWQQSGTYNAEMVRIGNRLRQYLSSEGP